MSERGLRNRASGGDRRRSEPEEREDFADAGMAGTGGSDDALDESAGADVGDGGELTDEGEALPDEVRAELEALAAAELDSGGELEQALAAAQREVARQRTATQAALGRYRDAVLAAEPDLPPELVRGETLEELEAAIAGARDVVARVRERVRGETSARGFPTGAPARESGRQAPLTTAEKIARGLDERR